MKHLLIILFLSILIGNATGQGIDFFHGSWEEAIEKAESENKLIFVDAYTTWCGPCRRMSQNVFPLEKVGDFYNANFINMKIDMEKEMGLKFKRSYTVTAYPTFFWINSDGEVVLTTKGGRQADDFIALGEAAAKKYDGSAKFKKAYDEGDRDFETVYNYIVALNNSGKSSLKIANEYFDTQTDLSTEENLKMLMVATTRTDSKLFEIFESHIKVLRKQEGEDAVDNVIRNAAFNTAVTGIEYESKSLLEESTEIMNEYLPSEADEFEVSTQMQYALRMEDSELYCPNAKTFVKKYANEDAETLAQVVADILKHFPKKEDCIAVGEKAAKQALELERNERHVMLYATMVFLGGDKSGALKVLDEAIDDPELAESAAKLKAARRQFEQA